MSIAMLFLSVVAIAADHQCHHNCSKQSKPDSCTCTDYYNDPRPRPPYYPAITCGGRHIGDGTICITIHDFTFEITLTLSNGDRTRIEKNEIFPRRGHLISYLFLDHNKISWIGPYGLHHMKSLKNLQLRHNRLSNLTKKSFAGLRKLEFLDLSHNHLSVLKTHVFYHLKRLDDLVLNRNPLEYIEPGAFEGLHALKRLSIGYANLKIITYQMFYGPIHLNYLNLQYNNLKFPPLFLLPDLRELILEGNPIQTLPPYGFGCLRHLVSLSLCRTRLGTLSQCAFCGLPHLDRLNLRNNPLLTTIDASVFGQRFTHTHLRNIDLSDCGITVLRDSVFPWNILNIAFEGNPIRCDCNWLWVVNSSVTFKNRIRCVEPKNLEGQDVRYLTEDNLICNEPNTTEIAGSLKWSKRANWITLKTVTTAVTFAFIIIILAFVIIYQKGLLSNLGHCSGFAEVVAGCAATEDMMA